MGLLRKIAIGGVLLFAVYKGCSCGYDKVNGYTEGGVEETVERTTRDLGKYVKKVGEYMENVGEEENNEQNPSELEKNVENQGGDNEVAENN